MVSPLCSLPVTGVVGLVVQETKWVIHRAPRGGIAQAGDGLPHPWGPPPALWRGQTRPTQTFSLNVLTLDAFIEYKLINKDWG